MRKELFRDHVHPNVEGYRAWADAQKVLVQKILRKMNVDHTKNDEIAATGEDWDYNLDDLDGRDDDIF